MKLLRNCALNAISALGHARYGDIAQNADAKLLMQHIVDEVLAVARAAGIALPTIADGQSGMAAAMELATQMSDALSSTAQDLDRGRPTEIDSLNGYICRRGAELGIPVTVNQALFTLVKLAEQQRVVPVLSERIRDLVVHLGFGVAPVRDFLRHLGGMLIRRPVERRIKDDHDPHRPAE